MSWSDQFALVDQTVHQWLASPSTARGCFIPHAVKVPIEGAEIYLVRNFLNCFECDSLRATIRSNLRASTLTPARVTTYRTSKTADLGVLGEALVDEVDGRICRLLGLSPHCSEPMQGQLYSKGQQFKRHTDYFKPSEMPSISGRLGQRTFSVLVYLNEPLLGGGTSFVDLGVCIRPEAGMALIWNNLTQDRKPNPLTRHQGDVVLRGSKAILTKWFRTNRTRTLFRKDLNEYIVPLTPVGFTKLKIPPQLFKDLRNWYYGNRLDASREHVDGDFLRACSSSKGPSELLSLPQILRDRVKADLKPLVESWLGRSVCPTFVYGIRIYRRGAMLMPHRDRIATHVVGAILNIDQAVEEDWPLEIEDHFYRAHRIILQPGEMILYEGARLLHSRRKPLRGSAYANLFCHFIPITTSAPPSSHP